MKNHEKSFLHRAVLVEHVHVWIQTVQNTVGGACESVFYSKSDNNYLCILQPDLQF